VTGFYSAKAFNARSKFPKSSELKSVSQKNGLFGCFLKNEYQNQKSYPQFMIKLRITFAQNRTGAEKRHKVSGFERNKI